jgi:hypothetical protein
MLALIILGLVAVIFLIMGFLEIKLPFISKRYSVGKDNITVSNASVNPTDNLVKDSVEATLSQTLFIKKQLKENYEGQLN